jgi:dissimilatory sulfite reductase (desulfoviridin) alpha/beta subunit
MQWTSEAEAAIKNVPFFVRKKVRARVEREAAAEGKAVVTIGEVKATQQRFLARMDKEVKGYQLDQCFGPNGCPNRATLGERLRDRVEETLKEADLLAFLRQTVEGDLKFHHEFRVTIADCPNACSQPQIKDIGIIGAHRPCISSEECSVCEACVEACQEAAITLEGSDGPHIDYAHCVACGQCIPVCPTGTLVTEEKGYRVQIGGKLGRHPALARELPGLYDETAVLRIVDTCLDHYKRHSQKGERFANIVWRQDINAFCKHLDDVAGTA